MVIFRHHSRYYTEKKGYEHSSSYLKEKQFVGITKNVFLFLVSISL